MQIFIKDIMQTEVDSVPLAATVEQSETIMLNTSRRCVPVVDENGNCVGVLSHSDLLRVRNDKKDVALTAVSDIMSRDIICVNPQSSVDNTAQLMLDKGIHHVLVIMDRKVRGIVSIIDLIQVDKARTFNLFAEPESVAPMSCNRQ